MSIYKFPPYKKTELLCNHLNMGGSNPTGESIEITSRYLERGGKPWIGVMGEYHFTRDKRENWYRELCKMKAGGITVVATYIFWIYHEEIEGEYDFTGDRDVKFFLEAASRAGLDVLLRIGPWAHGECRNGGFPDWLLQKEYSLRDTNEAYMAQVRIWYEKIYEQVKGFFYQDGGPIIGIQIENEFVDNADYLFALKRLAQEIGFQVPLYTVTGWNSKYGAKIPVDDVLPVFGAYPEAPWAGHTHKLPLSVHYVFQSMRNDSAIGEDLIGMTDEDGWRLPYERYPYVTCELGGGMQVTHHRRPVISGIDVYAISLCKLGSGNNLPGYYMYHGGTNKIGRLSTLNESKATGYPNDYTILSYDFQAPLSQYGEIREQYRMLNLLHLFINDFGELLAPMELVEPEKKVVPEDLKSLRYVMRTDGESGFVFVNHYQRLAHLSDVERVTIEALGNTFPEIAVRGDISFFLPVNMELSGNLLKAATAQPLCRVGNTYFFVAVPGIVTEYCFADGLSGNKEKRLWKETESTGENRFVVEKGREHVISVNNIKIVTLTWQEALYARKLSGKLYLGECCDLYEMDGEICAVRSNDCDEKSIKDASHSLFYRCWTEDGWEKHCLQAEDNCTKVRVENIPQAPFEPEYREELQLGGPRALTWKKITVSAPEGFIEFPEICDASQIYADGQLVADNFYYGKPWRVPAKLLCGKECYLVLSEWKDDFYREFESEIR